MGRPFCERVKTAKPSVVVGVLITIMACILIVLFQLNIGNATHENPAVGLFSNGPILYVSLLILGFVMIFA
jgi:uncharacterized BrkB/YihY/UPF0761 family membrane protein